MTGMTRPAGGAERLMLTVVLLVLGAGWGITMPLTKIAVSTGFGHFGLIFWQLVIGVVLMSLLLLLRGKGLPRPFQRGPGPWRVWAVIALVGTLVPNTASYQAAVHLPAGIMAILLSMIPMFAFPVALGMGLDRFSWRRLGGLVAGLTGVLLIVGPGARIAGDIPVFWVGVALIAGMCYAMEGNIVAKWGTAGMDPVEVLWGASLLGAIAVLPLTLLTGQFIPPGALNSTAGHALIGAALAHTGVYAGYVWLVGRAGAVFAVQVSYLVTGFGVFWAKLILDEAYVGVIWAALLMMFAGLYLVQPRPKPALAPA
ncbi:DMT family transporter [uncultured Roseobacter sp.]|uniref:DMT family transporter n=1 Tax=uncultured Roseobacter sp. TaxID=114847 RepID=UPI002630D614|nr:DMT family transporter [uncultured Roseobacter sp.]